MVSMVESCARTGIMTYNVAEDEGHFGFVIGVCEDVLRELVHTRPVSML